MSGIAFSITDAVNEAKDKVHYLESLKQFFDRLDKPDAVPQDASDVVRQLTAAIKSVESTSRHHAKTGFLGLVLSEARELHASYLIDTTSLVLGFISADDFVCEPLAKIHYDERGTRRLLDENPKRNRRQIDVNRRRKSSPQHLDPHR